MGVAEAIPGVSGSTAALLTGIYHELVTSLKSFDSTALKLIASKRFREFWKHINGNFLITVFAGAITGIVSFSRLIGYALKHNSIPLAAFFFGLIIMATPLVMREEIKKWDTIAIISFVVALALAYLITWLSPAQAPRTLWMMFVIGAVAGIITLIPGISFAYMLIMLGQFANFTAAIAGFNIAAIFLFIAGYCIGLIATARWINLLLGRYRRTVLAVFTGLMLGFLNKVWPWRDIVEFATNRNGEQITAFDKSILPWNYLASTEKDPQVFQAILMMALGVFIAILIEKIATRRKTIL